MNQNNDFNQFGFDHYAQPPRQTSPAEKLLGPTIGQKLRSPIFATAALLLAGVAFAGIIIASYPDSEGGEVPVVKADTFAYKEAPESPGGMQIANQDSTIFDSMQGEALRVENLLADEDGQQKFQEFARQVEEAVQEEQQAAAETAEKLMTVDEAILAAKTDGVSEPAIEPAAGDETPETAPVTLQKIVQKPQPPEAALEPAAEQVAQAEAPKPRIHRAGENPETLEFVRNVLDKKDTKEVLAAAPTNNTVTSTASDVASIAPASGVSGVDIRPGSHYVQLGSVKSASGAESEWGKIQKEFSSLLTGVNHRVKLADLGERGVFYRIQAGPMASDSAKSLCDAIKAQKPGGCLVTK